jgi:hypothetical protein
MTKLEVIAIVAEDGSEYRIQISEIDKPFASNWSTAEQVLDFENGWRLPSIIELKTIFKELYLNKMGKFQAVWYWSNDDNNPPYGAYTFNFKDGTVHNFSKNCFARVRGVRTMPINL